MNSQPVVSRRPWYLLGFAVLGLTTASTVVTVFLPLILNEYTDSRFAIGFGVGIEGAAALVIPLIIGAASDQTWNRLGRRLPYMLAATPLVILGLIGASLWHKYGLIVMSVSFFFIGYYAYYTAYQALYPDLLPSHEYGRAWAYQSIFQGVGVGLALLVGGALLTISTGLPFLATAGFFLVITLLTARWITEQQHGKVLIQKIPWHAAWPTFFRRLRSDYNLRWFMLMHFAWEFTLAAIRAFVLLYILTGLGLSHAELIPVLGVVIIAYLIASLLSGYVVDRFDARDYTELMITLFAGAMVIFGLVTDRDILGLVMPFGMFAGAAVLMLSYPILLKVTPEERRGEYTGYYQFNRGLALLLGTILAGGFIDLFGHYFPETQGYQVFWLLTAAMMLLSLIPLRVLTKVRA